METAAPYIVLTLWFLFGLLLAFLVGNIVQVVKLMKKHKKNLSKTTKIDNSRLCTSDTIPHTWKMVKMLLLKNKDGKMALDDSEKRFCAACGFIEGTQEMFTEETLAQINEALEKQAARQAEIDAEAKELEEYAEKRLDVKFKDFLAKSPGLAVEDARDAFYEGINSFQQVTQEMQEFHDFKAKERLMNEIRQIKGIKLADDPPNGSSEPSPDTRE